MIFVNSDFDREDAEFEVRQMQGAFMSVSDIKPKQSPAETQAKNGKGVTNYEHNLAIIKQLSELKKALNLDHSKKLREQSMIDFPGTLYGLQVMIAGSLRQEVRRTWFDRLTKRPLFVKYETRLIDVIPDRKVSRIGDTLLMNMKTYEYLKKAAGQE